MGVLHTPSRHTFECDGTQRVFPIPSLMISQDFVRIEIDGVLQSDRKQWDIVNNSLVFVLAPINGAILDVQVASDSESLGELGMMSNVDILAQNITNVNKVANNILDIQNAEENAIIAKEEAWRAEAERLTANSYATEPEDVYVKIYTSNNDGTFTVTDTTDYSAYHWERKATTLVTIGIIDDVTSSSDRTYSSNKIDSIVNGNVATLNNTTVKLTGNQNVGGIKTFISSPIVPTPTTDFQVATKKYADLKQSKSELAYNVNASSYIPNTLASGAIIERGSNSNGNYVKFADGTLICTMQGYLTGGVNAGTVFTFPHPFISTGYIESWGIMSQGGHYVDTYSWSGGRTTTSIMIVKSTAYEQAGARIVVIGQWK